MPGGGKAGKGSGGAKASNTSWYGQSTSKGKGKDGKDNGKAKGKGKDGGKDGKGKSKGKGGKAPYKGKGRGLGEAEWNGEWSGTWEDQAWSGEREWSQEAGQAQEGPWEPEPGEDVNGLMYRVNVGSLDLSVVDELMEFRVASGEYIPDHGPQS